MGWGGGEIQGGVDGDLSLSAGGLIPGGVTVLKNTMDIVARIQGRASCSQEDSRWCSVTSNTRRGSSNLGGELVVPGMILGGVVSRSIPGRVVRTLDGELVVPGMSPSGVASRPIPGRVVRTLGGELVVPGMIPGGVASCPLLFILGHLCL